MRHEPLFIVVICSMLLFFGVMALVMTLWYCNTKKRHMLNSKL